jgi:hypothetical protein
MSERKNLKKDLEKNRQAHASGGTIMKGIIVGGVAGGASRTTRLRRLDKKAKILCVRGS